MVCRPASSFGSLSPCSWHARLVLLTIWCCCAAILPVVFYQRSDESVTESTRRAGVMVPENGINGFSVRCVGGDRTDDGPAFCISASHLHADNGRYGILNTPLNKTLVVDDLVAQIRYCTDERAPKSNHGTGREEIHYARGLDPLLRRLQRGICDARDRVGVRVVLPVDISDATNLVAKNLHYEVYCDNNLELSIDCRRALFSASTAEVVLRGCVTIRGPDSCRLMGNCVRWDLEHQRFAVAGSCILNTRGVSFGARDVYCDHRLRVIGPCGTPAGKGDRPWVKAISR
jgi:hypothetical protein